MIAGTARKLIAPVGVTLFLAATGASAGDLAMSAKAGTLGLGVELSGGPTRFLNARLGANYFNYEFDDRHNGIEYDMELQLQSLAALLDWHPLGGSLRFTGGVLVNGNELAADGSPDSNGDYDINGTEYPAQLVGDLKADIGFEDFAPYVGMGLATNNGGDGGFGMSIDLGVAYQGVPDVGMVATGPISSDPDFQADLEKERRGLRRDLEDYKYYPVIAVGFSYRF